MESNLHDEVLYSGKKERYTIFFSYKLRIFEEISLSLSVAVISISFMVIYFLPLGTTSPEAD